MTERLGLLIVGGYGGFGGRIVQLLEVEPRLIVVVAGRSLDRAKAFCRARGATAAPLVAAALDRDGDCAAQLSSLRPDILVDASGPFQAYGARRYRLIEACIARGVHYLDLADGADFVAGVSAFDQAARAGRLFISSGVSSFPVLSAAAVRHLAAGLGSVDGIRAGLAPSPYAGLGRSVVRATAAYAGRPVPLKRDGAMATGHPFTEQIRFTVAPPGHLPLQNRLFSLVEVPDLRVLPDYGPRRSGCGSAPAPSPKFCTG
jgi:saccharopine dehydrogenase-like NADP-dependent oxidoreductase